MSSGDKLKDDDADGPGIYFGTIGFVFGVKLRSLIVVSSTANGAQLLLGECFFAEGPVYYFDSYRVLLEGLDHDVAGFQISVNDSLGLCAGVLAVVHDLLLPHELVVFGFFYDGGHYVGVEFGVDKIVVNVFHGANNL